MVKKVILLFLFAISLSLVSAGNFGYDTATGGGGTLTTITTDTNLTNLSEMSDTNIPSPTDGYVLTWDSATQMWIDQSAASVGDTNETTRFNALVGTDCSGTDKVTGVDNNGNLVCDTDLNTGGGGGGNTTEEMQDAVGGAFNSTLTYDDLNNIIAVNENWLQSFVESVITTFVDAPFVNALFTDDLTVDADSNLTEGDVDTYADNNNYLDLDTYPNADTDSTDDFNTNQDLNTTDDVIFNNMNSTEDVCITGGNCLSDAGTGSGDITSVNTNGNYLTGGSASGNVDLLLDETKLNDTIDSRDSDTTYSALSEFSNDVNFITNDTMNKTIDCSDISGSPDTDFCTDEVGTGEANQTISYDAGTDQITLDGNGGTIDITEVDTNTQLSEATVDSYADNNNYLDLDTYPNADTDSTDDSLAGDCPSGQVVQNTTASGVECVTQVTDTDTQLSQEQVEDYTGGMVNGSLSYDDTNGILFVTLSWINTQITNLVDASFVNALFADDLTTDDDTTYTAGDALTLTATDFDFDGGASPQGELGGTWANPTIDSGVHDDEYIELADAFGGEVSGTYGAITLDNNALDDQYYDSEADLTGLLDDNYVDVAGDTMTGDLSLGNNNVTDISYTKFCNGANCWQMYVNGSDYFIIEAI